MKKLKYLFLILLLGALSSCAVDRLDLNKEKEKVIKEAYEYVINFKSEVTSLGLNTSLPEIIPSFSKDGKFERFVFPIYRDDNLDSFLFAKRKSDGSYEFLVSHEADFEKDEVYESIEGKKYLIDSGSEPIGDILIGDNMEISFRTFDQVDESYRNEIVEKRLKDFDEKVERPDLSSNKDLADVDKSKDLLSEEEVEDSFREAYPNMKIVRIVPVLNGDGDTTSYLIGAESKNDQMRSLSIVLPYLVDGKLELIGSDTLQLMDRFPELFDITKDFNAYKYKGYGGFVFKIDGEVYNSRREGLDQKELERIENL